MILFKIGVTFTSLLDSTKGPGVPNRTSSSTRANLVEKHPKGQNMWTNVHACTRARHQYAHCKHTEHAREEASVRGNADLLKVAG